MSTRTQNRQLLSSGLVIAVAMGVMNVTNYAFTIMAARLLGPVEYGALAAVMGLLLVLNVLSLGLQATGARRVVAVPGDLAQIEHDVLRTTYLCAGVLGTATLLASPLIASLLNLDSWLTAALIAVTAVPLSIMGGQAGVLQGERRWVPLAIIYTSLGVARISFGLVAMLIEPDTLGAMIGVALGAFVPMLVGWWALRHPSRTGARQSRHPPRRTPYLTEGGVLRETMHNSHALLAFFALSNLDVLVARSVLDEHHAGLYAAGLILAKAVLFLPQFVVVIVFPAMSSSESARRMNLLALALVLTMGLAVVGGVALLSRLAVTFVGGAEYAEIQDQLWLFALLGTILAMLQVMVYNVVARQRQRSVLFIWAALVTLLVVAPFIGSVATLLTAVLAIDSLLFVVLLVQAGVQGRTARRRPGAVPIG